MPRLLGAHPPDRSGCAWWARDTATWPSSTSQPAWPRGSVQRVIDQDAPPVTALDEAAPDEARDLLRSCCASAAWLVAMVANRPYGTLDALIERSDGALALLDWSDVEEALANLRERLANDAGTEQGVIRGELAQIVRLRLAKAVP